MYVGRTSEITIMTNFENFYQDLLDLAKEGIEELIEIQREHLPNLKFS